MDTPEAQAAHRSFLNRYYRTVRHVYDPTRRFFLFGRDRVLADLLRERWQTLVEIGPGTGRNLRVLRRGRPNGRYGGIEASDEMLKHARRTCPWASLAHGFAESADIRAVLDAPPDRILFSYCLSMVGEPVTALRHARRALAPGGEIVIVDFGDLASTWAPAGAALRAFLGAFHVTSIDRALEEASAADVRWGPGRYYVTARLRAT